MLILGLQLGAFPTRAAYENPYRSTSKQVDFGTLVGVTFDTSPTQDRVYASSMGGRVARVHGFRLPDDQFFVWLGYGAEARLVTTGFDSIDGAIVNAVGRVGIAIIPPLEVEPVLGVAVGRDVVPIWGFALLLGVPWFGFGFSFQFPIVAERPAWLELAALAVRIQLPLFSAGSERR